MATCAARLALICAIVRARTPDSCKRWETEVSLVSDQASYDSAIDRGWLGRPSTPANRTVTRPLRLAVLIPWTGRPTRGELPWFPYWLASVRTNRAFADWIIFVDPGNDGLFGEAAPHVPNLKIVSTNLAQQYSKALHLNVPINHKNIKGLKVSLGVVWADYIKAYSHWCWSDVDVVYGDLARVLMPHLSLERYHDSYSLVTIMPSREHWCGMTRALFAGQMTIFRNDPATNSLFKSITGEHDWQKDFKNPGFSRMDEIYLPQAALDQHYKVLFLESQLTPQGFENKNGLMHRATMAWWDGRLVLLDPSGKPGGPVRAEAALLHLNTFKGKNTKIMFSSKATQPEQIDAPRGFLMPLFGDQQWRPLTGDEIAQLRRRAPVNDTGAYVPAGARR